jgi:DNA-binding transcriptional ArsR family regulator
VHPFQVMAEPIRRRIVEVLASGEHTSGEVCESIAAEFGVSRAAVGRHLGILRENQWVHMRPDYTMRLYRLDDRAIERLSREVARLRALWRRRIGEGYGTDTPLENARPLEQPRRRLATGTAKGMRGHRHDAWRP